MNSIADFGVVFNKFSRISEWGSYFYLEPLIAAFIIINLSTWVGIQLRPMEWRCNLIIATAWHYYLLKNSILFSSNCDTLTWNFPISQNFVPFWSIFQQSGVM